MDSTIKIRSGSKTSSRHLTIMYMAETLFSCRRKTLMIFFVYDFIWLIWYCYYLTPDYIKFSLMWLREITPVISHGKSMLTLWHGATSELLTLCDWNLSAGKCGLPSQRESNAKFDYFFVDNMNKFWAPNGAYGYLKRHCTDATPL